ncbi:MAG: hypothetical protein OXE59_09325 [Bacteroidetes bacterium]|nr:hypothetical protein [Bacteroidota bacterium]
MVNISHNKVTSGHFTVLPSEKVYGQLCLSSTNGYLHLLSEVELKHIEKISNQVIHGVLENGDHVTYLIATFQGRGCFKVS